MDSGMRAAVIGASGIGKHHAKWLKALGCEVVAFAGSSDETVAATGRTLQEQLGIQARGYRDVPKMLEEMRPELVSICSPPALHYEHFLSAAAHGCHVLCEKPLVWDDAKSPDQLLLEAGEMAAYGCNHVVGAVNTQYKAAVAPYMDLCQRLGLQTGAAETFFMKMDSRDPQKLHERVWVDLANHPLSVLMQFCGPGQIVPGSEHVVIGRHLTSARFGYAAQHGPVCSVEILVRAGQNEKLVRSFGINGIIAEYEGRNDENGLFRTYLSIQGQEFCSDDLMCVSLRRFVEAAQGHGPGPLADLQDGYSNQAMQLALLQAATLN